MLMWIKLKSSVFQVLRVALHYTNATCQWFFSKTHALRGLLVKPVNVLSRSSSFLSSFLFMKNGLNFHPSPCISSTFWSHNLTAVLFFLLLRGEARVLDRGQCCASELYGPVPSLGCHCRDLGRNGVCPHHSSALLVPSKLPVFVTRLLFLAQRRELSRRIWGNARPPLSVTATTRSPATSHKEASSYGCYLSLQRVSSSHWRPAERSLCSNDGSDVRAACSCLVTASDPGLDGI